jgi:hypothetical protein
MNGTILSSRNESYKAEHIKAAFEKFMCIANPTVKPKTLKTYCSDAMFIWEQLPDKWVWKIVDGVERCDAEWKVLIQTYIRRDITATRTCPDKDARSYTKHFWQLILFLRIFNLIEEGRIATPRRIGE